eukprot:scaffold3056_cov666-Pavlova_lutheri.AAC.1
MSSMGTRCVSEVVRDVGGTHGWVVESTVPFFALHDVALETEKEKSAKPLNRVPTGRNAGGPNRVKQRGGGGRRE